VKTNTLFRLATSVLALVVVVALQLQAVAQEKGKETPVASPKAATPPACIDCPPARFPPEAPRAKILEGNVLLEITVSEKGRPSDIQVLSDPGNGFAREAVDAVKHWKFKPAIAEDGRKISKRIQINVVSRQM
jgi:TonB family protein